LVILALATLAWACFAAERASIRVRRLELIIGERPGEITRNAAETCRSWITRRSNVEVAILPRLSEHQSADAVALFLGTAQDNAALTGFFRTTFRDLPDAKSPGEEGFTILTAFQRHPPQMALAGSDARGVVYAVGELVLRRIRYLQDAVEIPAIEFSSGPAFSVRGGNAAHISEQVQQTMPMRKWTEEEWQSYAIQHVLNGANNFDVWRTNRFPEKHRQAFPFFKSFGMTTTTGHRLNNLMDAPPEWAGSEGSSPSYGLWVCPSIPAARMALHLQWEKDFAAEPAHDYLRLYSGDPGGCRCDKCLPNWGSVYIKLCEEAAQVWTKYHPNSRIIITNQDLTNDGDRAILDYVQVEPRNWLFALNYGPGSNAMDTYFREELRSDLFRYPGLGPNVRYLQELNRQLPPRHALIHFTDLTHWIQSQYGFQAVDPVLAAVHGRRSFHVRPRALHKIFQQTMAFAIGDMPYTEGMHDHFNQYLWLRLLWDPNLSPETIASEYARIWFGDEAAPDMAEALLQFEDNLPRRLVDNPGIDRFYRLVFGAKSRIRPAVMRNDLWWSMLAQRAAIDKYLQLKVQRASALNQSIAAMLRNATNRAAIVATAARIEKILAAEKDTAEAKLLLEQARILGEETSRRIGFREIGFFRLDQDYAGNRWLLRQLRRLLSSGDDARLVAEVKRLASYPSVGPGEFYDNPGSLTGTPHMVRGRQRPAIGAGLSPENRLSNNSSAYSHRGKEGVAFRYQGLDPDSKYEARLVLVSSSRSYHERLRVNGELASDWIEVPAGKAGEFIVPLPVQQTKLGRILLEFEPEGSRQSTTVSEIWIQKAGSR
jgi:hypothetical protein